MAPKKPVSTIKKGKGKGKNQENSVHTNEERYAEIQYPNGVFLGKEWKSHLTNMSINDYNHHQSTIEKEMVLELVHPKNKWTIEGFPIHDDDV